MVVTLKIASICTYGLLQISDLAFDSAFSKIQFPMDLLLNIKILVSR